MSSKVHKQEIPEEWNRIVQAAWEAAPEDVAKIANCLSELQQYTKNQEGIPPLLVIHQKALSAMLLAKKDEYIKALAEARQAYEISVTSELFEGRIRALRVLSLIYGQLGRTEDCLKTAREGITQISRDNCILTENNGLPLEFIFRNNIATMYAIQSRHNEAIDQYERAKELIGPYFPMPWVFVLTNLGSSYVSAGNPERGMELVVEALEIASREKLEAHIMQICYCAIGMTYKQIGKIEEALHHFQHAYEIAESGNSRYDLLDVLVELLHLKLDHGIMENTLPELEKGVRIGEELQAHSLLQQIYRLKAIYHEKNEQPKKALEFYKKYMELHSLVSTKETESLLNAYSIEFQVEKAHRDAEILQLRNHVLEKEHHNLMVLSEIGRDITSSMGFTQLVEKTYNNLTNLMKINAFAIAQYDERKSELEFLSAIENGRHLPKQKISLVDYHGFSGRCIKTRETLLMSEIDPQKMKEYKVLKSNDQKLLPKSVIYHPLILDHNVIGLITVQSFESKAYTENELEIVKILGAYIAIALNNSRKSEELTAVIRELEIASTTDPLTGIYNRRFMTERLEQEYLRYKRYQHPFSIIIADIDYFKLINDNFGHDCGDLILIQVSSKMQEALRSQDCIARWGGEEFLILLPETAQKQALEIAERLRTLLMNSPMNYKNQSISITSTFGVAEALGSMSLAELVKHADKGLYSGKRSGRNKSVVFSQSINGRE